MGKICAMTGKKSRASATRSHSNIQSKGRQKANLHKRRIDGKIVILSTRALKTLKKKAAEMAQA